MYYIILLLVSIALIIVGVVPSEIGINIPLWSRFLLVGFGVIFLFIIGLIAMINRLYHRTAANEAFVRTGWRGAKVILDGGAIIIPVLHQVISVPLETMRLDVERVGKDALITKDYLRADLKAEFYIRVQPKEDHVLNAARSLGERSINAQAVKELVFDKLVSALRTVAANKTLDELNTRRNEFALEVQNIVITDLVHNGLTLESVTISKLDQTDSKLLNQNNVFDAQGLKRITEITQAALVIKNELERQAEQKMTEKNVATKKQVLALEQDQASAEAFQRAEIAKIKAEKEREASQFQIEQERLIAEAEVEKNRAVEAKKIQAQQSLIQADRERELAEIEKNKAIEIAAVEKTKAVEVAAREQQIVIANKEAQRAAAEAERLAKEAERELQAQAVITVKVTESAKREKQESVIRAEAEAEQELVKKQRNADAEAYRLSKLAEGQKKAAEAEYEAKLKLASADAESAKIRAEGEQALKMVDINVAKEQVNVEQARVNVLRQELETKSQHQSVALDFELAKLRIEAEKEIRCAAAQAVSNFMSRGDIKVFGDPETMAKMYEKYMQALGVTTILDGFLTGGDGKSAEIIGKIEDSLGPLLTKLSSKITGETHPKEPTVPKD